MVVVINKIRIVTLMMMVMLTRMVRKMVMKMVRISDGEQVHYCNRGDATVFRGGHHAIME